MNNNVYLDPVAMSNNIKNLCESRNITATKLHNALGDVSVQGCHKWLRGDGSIPSLDNLVRIAHYLDVSLDELVAITRY
ncbi:MAG: helix-turn-helix transcriptional regulator [Lachnospiraceae bacterium]|nr:helix-turn-helix transcriptional regulator [Lachnospiraceae bacterium]MBQ8318686.1 helix-turn-helix transcriptional regulator [Lachnospiraceae bacterium]MBR3599938.1 helix-turn-helix transcriptional regulator [Lachnospiraceae bacterium]